MFDLGWSELVLVAVIALIVIGPKELPGILRMVGQWAGKIRRMAAEFQGQFGEALREAEMADLKKQVDDISDTARSIGRFDPLADQPSKPLAEPTKPALEPNGPAEIADAGESALVDAAGSPHALPAVNEAGTSTAELPPPEAGGTEYAAEPPAPAPTKPVKAEPVPPAESGAAQAAAPANAGAPSTDPRPLP
jgi:sec-independent protein translocase protein TatB